MIGALGSSIVILLLIAGRRLPDQLHFMRPSSLSEAVRAAIIAIWFGLLAWAIAAGIPDGDESFIFPEIIAALTLWIVLNARPVRPAIGLKQIRDDQEHDAPARRLNTE